MKIKKMELDSFFVYSWNINEEEKNITSIRAYGLDKNNENVCVRIDDFTPYVYVELPERIEWTDTRAQLVGNKIDELLGESKPIKKSLVYKKKLYFAYLDKNKSQKLFPYLFLSFSSKNDINSFIYRTKKPISVQGVGFMKTDVCQRYSILGMDYFQR